MTQISRPFQIAFVVLLLFVALWFAVLRGHSSSSTGSSAPVASSVSSGSQSSAASSGSASSGSAASSPGGGTQASKGGTYHGSAPGVAGLSRAIQKARGAVTQSQQNAQQLQRKSAQASDEAHSQSASTNKVSTTQAAGTPSTSSKASATNTPSTGAAAAKQAPSTAAKAKNVPAKQATVEAQLKQGKVVAILFWNSKGTVDGVVRRELQSAGRKLHGKLAVQVASPSQVGSFGSFTHAVQVYSTPTILLINDKGATSSVSGLTDSFSIEQAVREVKSAKS